MAEPDDSGASETIAKSSDAASRWAEADADVLAGAGRGAERVLAQEEIDSLLGFRSQEEVATEQTGIRALINSGIVSYERLPMLEVVFDRLVRLATTSVRNFTSDNVDVALDRITSVRFMDYIDSIPLPAMLGVFRAEEWDNFGLISADSNLIYSIIDVLLGGGRSGSPSRMLGRPHTTIENSLVSRLFEILLADAEQAFRPVSPVGVCANAVPAIDPAARTTHATVSFPLDAMS